MPRIDHRELQAGMVVAKEVLNSRGQLLIPTGTALTEKHLSALKMWGITSVDIDSGDAADEGANGAQVSQEVLEWSRKRTEELMALNGSIKAHPASDALANLCAARLIKQAVANGKEATAVLETRKREKDASEPKIDTPERLVKRLGALGSLPAIYREMMEVVNHPLSSATDLANVISKDTGLTARLLRIVNSAFYGFPAKIETVSRATAIMGTNELCQLALATSVMTSFDNALSGLVNMGRFWLHSLCCGTVARLIAKSKGESNTERFFVIGLLHDVGRLGMLSEIPLATFKALESSATGPKAPCEAEREVIGFSHAAVGKALLDAWNLPPAQQDAVGCHHAPLSSRQYKQEAAIAHIAEVLTHSMRVGGSGNPVIPRLVPQAWDSLDLDVNMFSALADEAERQVLELASIFNVEQ